ncbi:MAG: aconitate hydratase AcnA [Conexivisphaerales archaeon]
MPFGYEFTKSSMETHKGKAVVYDITKLKKEGVDVDSLPYSIRILLENALRFSGKVHGAGEAADELMHWPKSVGKELPFMPSRVLLQDYTGVPLIVDLAALRDAVSERGLDPRKVNSKVPVDLIIDHSVQVDSWARDDSIFINLSKEYERNSERYSLLRWAQNSFTNMRIFPPGKGICHQVNLEYLSTVISLRDEEGILSAFPDTLVGTDSHTTMVNGMGVLGWGVGGIEAEAVMLGEPYHMPIPSVVGVEITGELQEGATPTDLVLTVTERLRKKGVVGQFVEYFGDGFSNLTVADRATIGNMSPEYGATVGFAPVDDATLRYLQGTGRSMEHVLFVEKYSKQFGFFYSPDSHMPKYSDVVKIRLEEVEPSIAGPRNPDERIPLKDAPSMVEAIINEYRKKKRNNNFPASSIADNGFELVGYGNQVQVSKSSDGIDDGSVVIAAITSCTNTSNPTVMLGAALMARKAAELGLAPKRYVKTSMAPGSRVVTDYLENSGLLPYLDRLGFTVVGYGCTTCIGNSGPLAPEIEAEIKQKDLYAVAVLSGNRNFDGRIHPLAKGSFLTSPMLVVAYALAGKITFDFYRQPLGRGKDGRDIYLKDIWPSVKEIKDKVDTSLNPELYTKRYSDALEGDERWKSLRFVEGDVFAWDDTSTYIRQPPWFKQNLAEQNKSDIKNGRVLAVFEDKVTTDHISPAGTIPYESPAGLYLREHGIDIVDFSTYGSRRGNHEVMVRGGFSNIRLRNIIAKGKEGGWTTHFPSGELMTIYEAAMKYAQENVPLIVLAGKQYGAGSSRDWAAKAPQLLGVRAVIAESFERIHRSNLVAMGILPLEFQNGQSWKSLGLSGDEIYDIQGIAKMSKPQETLKVRVKKNGKSTEFDVTARIDNQTELLYYKNGGILPYIFRKLVESELPRP